MKKIIFFDGDGTLWYPKRTKRRVAPHWVYSHPDTMDDPIAHLVLTPNALATLRKLSNRGAMNVILSASPFPAKAGRALLRAKVKHFGLEGMIHEIHATGVQRYSKGRYMVRILKRLDIPKKHALMVGDKCAWDYMPARRNGIDALLMESDYERADPHGKRIRRKIKNLSGVLKYV